LEHTFKFCLEFTGLQIAFLTYDLDFGLISERIMYGF